MVEGSGDWISIQGRIKMFSLLRVILCDNLVYALDSVYLCEWVKAGFRE